MVPSGLSILMIAGFLTAFVGHASAADFLGAPMVSVQQLEAQLLEDLSVSQNRSSSPAQERLVKLETSLRPLFDVVPKRADGTLGHNAVRYVLHRFFVRQHGWFIRGLEPGSDLATLSSSSNVSNTSNASHGLDPSGHALQSVEEWVPTYLQHFLESIVGARGVNLRELAVLAATVIEFVHKEEIGHLHSVYDALSIARQRRLNERAAYYLLQVYMTIFMSGGDWPVHTPRAAARAVALFAEKEPSWAKMLPWLRQMQLRIQGDKYATFRCVSQIVEEIGATYAVFNDKECSRLKVALSGMESQKPGRVRLSDFYRQGLAGEWQFTEKIDYLRSAGLLDESDPNTPLLLVPNYVASRVNCLNSSSFYALCCRSQCDDLMQSLERELGKPTARPPQISKIVANFTTASIPEPRKLSRVLMRRLQEIASRSHGHVPIHGRLFAQWMHHAFPRECPYPHASGTVHPLSPDEWMRKTGSKDSRASQEEMMSMIGNDTCRFAPKGFDCGGNVITQADDVDLPWDMTEELLIIREQPQPVSPFSSDVEVFTKNRKLHPLRDILCWVSVLSLLFIASAVCWFTKLNPQGAVFFSHACCLVGAMARKDGHARL